jgi:hypothetical protein
MNGIEWTPHSSPLKGFNRTRHQARVSAYTPLRLDQI